MTLEGVSRPEGPAYTVNPWQRAQQRQEKLNFSDHSLRNWLVGSKKFRNRSPCRPTKRQMKGQSTAHIIEALRMDACGDAASSAVELNPIMAAIKAATAQHTRLQLASVQSEGQPVAMQQRVARLRQRCLEQLGEERFSRLYIFLQERSSLYADMTEDDFVFNIELEEILGEDREYGPLMDELVYLETNILSKDC
ncbi:hypothetical protein CYMTET_7334 [Cymbomonas tetramitiformis]|uniref:Uncharacterized protein n=1 Tax=Cymbomonas tetramitiformis TaxID=36881 RepID=A0AAE0GVB9_9CHLO|nr:hypothetical protein CYMTET_7334 [Cymbomonas tetramitiformis]